MNIKKNRIKLSVMKSNNFLIAQGTLYAMFILQTNKQNILFYQVQKEWKWKK